MAELRGNILTPLGFIFGTIKFFQNITEIVYENGLSEKELVKKELPEMHAPIILPGFIDTHVHGGGGYDSMQGSDAVANLAAFHAQHGVTTLFPTTMTAPWDEVLFALDGIRSASLNQNNALSNIAGAHLEGPFISPERLGAQPGYAIEPDLEKIEEVLAKDIVRLATIAPEIEGALGAARALAQSSVRISIGHSKASIEQCLSFIEDIKNVGAVIGFTHLYNAMSGFKARNPGVIGSCFVDEDSFAEVIFDGYHIHPQNLKTIMKLKPKKVHLITDAIAACGTSVSSTKLGRQTVEVKEDRATLKDGTIAGSMLTLDKALKNVLAQGVSLFDASQMLSKTPATYMGLYDRGSLEPSKRADIVVLNEHYQVNQVFIRGQQVR